MNFHMPNSPSRRDADEKVVCAAKRGDPEALDEVTRLVKQYCFTICVEILGCPDQAEDALVVIEESVYRHLIGFRAEASFRTWVYRIAVRQCRHMRKRARPTLSFDAVDLDVADSGVGLEDEVINRLHQADLIAVLEGYVSRLPTEQRNVFKMHNEGMSIQEISEVLGCKRTTTAQRYRYACDKLKHLLRTEHPELCDENPIGHEPREAPKAASERNSHVR